MSGPLKGLKVIEFGGIGPGPFCAMMLADMGADVIRLDRKADKGKDRGDAGVPGQRPAQRAAPRPALGGGRSQVAAGSRQGAGHAGRRRRADRRLPPRRDGAPGPGPGRAAGAQPAPGLRPHDRLGPGRPAGAGRGARHQLHRAVGRAGHHRPQGRRADRAGGHDRRPRRRRHDAGLRHHVRGVRGHATRAAARSSTRRCSTARRCSPPSSASCAPSATGRTSASPTCWTAARISTTPTNAPTGSGSPSARWSRSSTRCCSQKLAITDPEFQRQRDPSAWPSLKAKLAAIFRSQPSAHWCALLENTDVCFGPVLSTGEAARHPHNVARATFFESQGVVQPSPAPRFSRTPATRPGPAPYIGEHDDELL